MPLHFACKQPLLCWLMLASYLHLSPNRLLLCCLVMSLIVAVDVFIPCSECFCLVLSILLLCILGCQFFLYLQTNVTVKVFWSTSACTDPAEWQEVTWRKRGQQQRLPELVVGSEPVSIEQAKKDHLIRLTALYGMARDQRNFFMNLPVR